MVYFEHYVFEEYDNPHVLHVTVSQSYTVCPFKGSMPTSAQ